MRKKRCLKTLIAFAAVLALAMGLMAGCGSKDKGEGITVYAGNYMFGKSLDPVKGGMSNGYPIYCDGLIRVNEKGEYVGNLAKAWTVSEDGKGYTFTLKEGIKFHDGKKFTAKDVAFTYNKVKENQAKNENVDLSKMASVTAADDKTVIFTLSEPYSSFLDQTALLGIVPAASYDSKTFDKKPVGTGPWKVEQFDTDQKLILAANKDYHDGAPSIPQVTLLKMDPKTAMANAKSGELDVVMVENTYAKKKVDGMHIENLPTIDVRQISLPLEKVQDYKNDKGKTVKVGNDVTSDSAVRNALNIGIDRKTIIKNGLNGIGKPSMGFPAQLSWAVPQEVKDNRKEEAMKIMETAGWIKGSDGIYEKNGVKCQFTVLSPKEDEERFQLVTATAAEAKKIGIKIEVVQKTWDEIPKESAGASVVWGWGQYDPVVLKKMFYSKEFTGGDFSNTVRFNNPQVDALIDQALSASDHDTSVAKWKEVQSKALEENAYLYLVNIEHSYFIKDNLDISLKTQMPHPHGHGAPIINNMKDWKLK